MASFTITVPENKLQDFIDAYGQAYDAYLPTGEPNPESKADFAKAALLKHIRHPVIRYVQNRDAPAEPDPGIGLT